jgi:hypothetical protein
MISPLRGGLLTKWCNAVGSELPAVIDEIMRESRFRRAAQVTSSDNGRNELSANEKIFV